MQCGRPQGPAVRCRRVVPSAASAAGLPPTPVSLPARRLARLRSGTVPASASPSPSDSLRSFERERDRAASGERFRTRPRRPPSTPHRRPWTATLDAPSAANRCSRRDLLMGAPAVQSVSFQKSLLSH